ncbi:protein MCM10 homolog [Diorhabda sublineata]|uniref:protein MCM10 homolog n=1 Tax=Diorhabda sublineata TaxID=1163346 RepID=UPI0024E0C84C|nr:protein MCM10 homolog [Diorhabda sublineata]
MSETHDPLDLLLLAANEELEVPNKQKILQETDLFCKETNLPSSGQIKTSNKSLLHNGDTDSSDDEDRRNWEDKKYLESGREIKKILDVHTKIGTKTNRLSRVSDWKKPPHKISNIVQSSNNEATKIDVYTDPIFGLRIINPLVSSAVLRDRMIGREAVHFNKLNRFLEIKSQDKDWVIAGVIVHKSAPKTSQKGNQFSVWTLSDLKDDIKTVAVFLFSGAHKQLWKTTVGTVVGLLNPNVLDKKDGKDEASLSIMNAQKVMIFGQSKDFGTCKSVKKNGDKCNSIVNTSRCEYCIYHIKQEYQKCSGRSDLQSSFTGKGLTALRNKVLGKNEVFYAGKSYMAVPAKRSSKLENKDNTRLNNLSGKCSVQNPVKANFKKKGNAARLEISQTQRLNDIRLLQKLNGTKDVTENKNVQAKHSAHITVEDAKNLATSVLSQLKEKNRQKQIDEKQIESKSQKFDVSNKIPMLTGFETGSIDLSKSVAPRSIQKAKLNAIKLIQKIGPIKKADPNNIRGTGIKRAIEDNKIENDSKKIKIDDNPFTSERFKKIMAAGSSHQELIAAREEEEKDKYFHKLEMKEKMEEKMISTHKVACKAVKCLECKYVSFSASDFCKSERHQLKVFDAFKRFFKCGDCQNRTVSLEIVPLKACNNCGGSNWQKTGMMKEKIATATPKLSIRGGEQTFTNSVVTDANLDLLVPE